MLTVAVTASERNMLTVLVCLREEYDNRAVTASERNMLTVAVTALEKNMLTVLLLPEREIC